jgi:SAM-dependent methyltransferase
MDDNTIEIRDDAINVEEIMAKIRENIRRRQAAGELPPDPDSLIGSPSKNCYAGGSDDTIQRDLSYINSNWDIHNNSYFISSHHPHIGKFLVRGRQMVHGEVRRYVDPMISRQTEFNASTVRIISRASQQYTELNQRQQVLETAFSSFKQESDKKIADCVSTLQNELDSKIEATIKDRYENLELMRHEFIALLKKCTGMVRSELNAEIEATIKDRYENLELMRHEFITLLKKCTGMVRSELNAEIEAKVQERQLIREERRTDIDQDIHSLASLAHVLEDRIQKGLAQKSPALITNVKEHTNYFLFEERFRGSREEITKRQLEFLPYFEKCSRVLDIGCGRGEFLEILKDHDIGSIGVDSDLDMVAYCRSRKLEVEHSDAIAYLETLENESLDGIFIDQVVEHLEPDYLIRLLALCHQKMKSGYYIVVETVNPLSFVSFVNFYIDMTHKKPVHPETLEFLLSAAGFLECERKFFSPVPEEGRLKKIEGSVDMNAAESSNIEIYNHNVEMLNSVLFGAQDYVVIGKK